MAAVRITEQLQASGYLELSRNGPAAAAYPYGHAQ